MAADEVTVTGTGAGGGTLGLRFALVSAQPR